MQTTEKIEKGMPENPDKVGTIVRSQALLGKPCSSFGSNYMVNLPSLEP